MEVTLMQAQVGDKLVVKGHKVGDHDRVGLIHEVRGADGGPPFLVEWDDAPGEHMVWPGSDALVEHFEHEVHTKTPH
jgi:hypothetical protein